MSELIGEKNNRNLLRWQLLAGVSAAAVLAFATAPAMADRDENHPTVWIELGGQLERVDGGQDPYAPGFTTPATSAAVFGPVSPAESQRTARFSFGGEGKIAFQPETSDWIFTAGIRFGRSNSSRHIHQQSEVSTRVDVKGTKYRTAAGQQFFDSKAKDSESHLVLDFQAGKDVGLGMFGNKSSSVLSLGVRVAQFTSRSQVSMAARPHMSFYTQPVGSYHFPLTKHHDFLAQSKSQRSFTGIGPSLTWNASAPIATHQDGDISLDWGVNAAVLFGRQKARGGHQQTENYYRQKYSSPLPPYGVVNIYQHQTPHNRAKLVIVPNVGGFAGISYRYQNAKVSFGYRADLFFGAMDVGIDTMHKADRDYYGPFATISIGLGG